MEINDHYQDLIGSTKEKFVEFIKANTPKITQVIVESVKSRCCGRCDGHYSICVADEICEEHKSMGCEICFGERETITTMSVEDIDGDINHLAQKVAQNLFLYEDNLSTAKADYLSLLALLLKKGVIF